jgi:ZIP family zinc transporter
MNGLLLQVTLYGAICGIAIFAGTIISSRWWTPSPRSRSYIQHLAGGLVFAAVGVEVLPDLMHRALPAAAAIGFILGVALVTGIELLAEKLGKKNGQNNGEGPWSLLGAIVVDIFIDGLLIGVASVAGGEGGSQALLVTIALATEMLSLGLSLGSTLVNKNGFSKKRALLTGGILGLAPFVGALSGFGFGSHLDGFWTEGILAFAAAALLYLAVEELLKDAHEVKDTKIGDLLFFGAFFAIMIIDMLS